MWKSVKVSTKEDSGLNFGFRGVEDEDQREDAGQLRQRDPGPGHGGLALEERRGNFWGVWQELDGWEYRTHTGLENTTE